MSPTVYRHKGYGHRFYLFSREETRMHVHASARKGEGKFWIELEIDLGFGSAMGRREEARAMHHCREAGNGTERHDGRNERRGPASHGALADGSRSLSALEGRADGRYQAHFGHV